MKNFKFIFTVLLFLCSIVSIGQVGIGTTVPDGALDISSSTDGLLIPRVALVNTTTVTVLTGTASELVYNTTSNASVTPGFYYLSTATGPWIRIATGNEGWLTTGNTGTSDATNYIGTADEVTAVNVAFRRDNVPAGKIGATSTSFGVNALNAGANSNSSAFGTSALRLNTGADNVAVGNGTLAVNVTGIQNTGIGNAALSLNTGNASTAIGFEALKVNTNGNNGTAVGFQALAKNTAASGNTGIGFQALTNNTIGSENTAVGFQASNSGVSGTKNSAFGQGALFNNLGSENTAIGHSALRGINNNAARFNTAVGYQAMFAGTGSVTNAVAVGANALFQNTASNATAVGYNALQGQIGAATGNTGVGFSVLNNNASGDNNTAVGNEAGFAAVGSGNTLIGYFAGRFASNVTGASTFVGHQAGQGSTGANNTVIGHNAMIATGASANSVAVGNNALTGNTAANNTAVGFSALVANISGTGNVAIGNQAGFSETGSNKLYISNSATTATTSLIYGDFSGTRILRTNSTFQIGDPTTTGYVFPMARGTANQYLASDASGVLSWTSPNSLSAIRTNKSSDQALTGLGWEKILFDTENFDTNAEFAGSTFTATKAGIYQINAGFHIDNQSNTQFYSIGVYVNGSLYQQTSGNHTSLGPVSRNINCSVNLAVGGYVEIFVENYQTPVSIDSYSGKTFFEVHQIR